MWALDLHEPSRTEDTILVTDDYAVQNTAIQLGIKVMPAGQKNPGYHSLGKILNGMQAALP